MATRDRCASSSRSARRGLFQLPPAGDVDHRRQDESACLGRHRTERHLHRELAAILATGEQFGATGAHRTGLRVRGIERAQAGVRATQAFGNQTGRPACPPARRAYGRTGLPLAHWPAISRPCSVRPEGSRSARLRPPRGNASRWRSGARAVPPRSGPSPVRSPWPARSRRSSARPSSVHAPAPAWSTRQSPRPLQCTTTPPPTTTARLMWTSAPPRRHSVIEAPMTKAASTRLPVCGTMAEGVGDAHRAGDDDTPPQQQERIQRRNFGQVDVHACVEVQRQRDQTQAGDGAGEPETAGVEVEVGEPDDGEHEDRQRYVGPTQGGGVGVGRRRECISTSSKAPTAVAEGECGDQQVGGRDFA